MRSIFAILFAIWYLFLSVGFSHNRHYCGGRLVKNDWQIVYHDLSCGMIQDRSYSCENNPALQSNCCQNKIEKFQINTQAEVVSSLFKNISEKFHFVDFIPFSFVYDLNCIANISFHDPPCLPEKFQLPAFLIFCNLRL
ncbi:MAG: hypothetical protein KatS3mg034_1069 [Vicingaceae bacterium]|nr:MAG: hypothetical protein KatS3mg034_1069 [Vicingaceae bacterium]